MNLSEQDQHLLKDVALDSIRHGTETGRALPVSAEDYPPDLRTHAATFVTLLKQGRLRGCIGRLAAAQPLVVDVAENAFSAAFHDSRFEPVQDSEIPELTLKISILGSPEPLPFDSESHLLTVIRPGEDGLIFEAEGRRSVLLPSVWPQVSGPEEFLDILKRKAGLPSGFWSDSVRMQRFGTREF